MDLKNKKIGVAITGSYCNFSHIEEIIHTLQNEGAKVIPIISDNVKNITTRFYKKEEFVKVLEELCNGKVIDKIVSAEPIGPKDLIDILVILPCTGNTLAKITSGISDTPVTMAYKSHIRNNKPVVIGISSNDGLGNNFKNIAELYNIKNVYFVPFSQDEPLKKPKSLVLKYDKVVETIKDALEYKQIQPVIG